MVCNVCHKKPASVHFKHVSNNKVVEVHLCDDCAHEKGIDFFKMDDMPFDEQQFGLAELLAGFTDVPASLKKKKVAVKCPNCGTPVLKNVRGYFYGEHKCKRCKRKYFILVDNKGLTVKSVK